MSSRFYLILMIVMVLGYPFYSATFDYVAEEIITAAKEHFKSSSENDQQKIQEVREKLAQKKAQQQSTAVAAASNINNNNSQESQQPPVQKVNKFHLFNADQYGLELDEEEQNEADIMKDKGYTDEKIYKYIITTRMEKLKDQRFTERVYAMVNWYKQNKPYLDIRPTSVYNNRYIKIKDAKTGKEYTSPYLIVNMSYADVANEDNGREPIFQVINYDPSYLNKSVPVFTVVNINNGNIYKYHINNEGGAYKDYIISSDNPNLSVSLEELNQDDFRYSDYLDNLSYEQLLALNNQTYNPFKQ